MHGIAASTMELAGRSAAGGVKSFLPCLQLAALFHTGMSCAVADLHNLQLCYLQDLLLSTCMVP